MIDYDYKNSTSYDLLNWTLFPWVSVNSTAINILPRTVYIISRNAYTKSIHYQSNTNK